MRYIVCDTMGFIDVSSPMKWGIVKIIAVVLCLLIIVGVFLPWSWYEVKTTGVTVHHESVGIDDYSESYMIIFATLFSLLFIFLSYNINVSISNKPQRINELLSGLLALLIFLDSANMARIISKQAANVRAGSTSVSMGIGSGIWLIVISSFLLMIFSFLLWKQRSHGIVASAATPPTLQTYPSTVPKPVETTSVTPAPAPLSKEEAVTVFSKIPGITVKKAILLYNAGYKSFSDLRITSPDKLLCIKGITSKDVKNIKKELEF